MSIAEKILTKMNHSSLLPYIAASLWGGVGEYHPHTHKFNKTKHPKLDFLLIQTIIKKPVSLHTQLRKLSEQFPKDLQDKVKYFQSLLNDAKYQLNSYNLIQFGETLITTDRLLNNLGFGFEEIHQICIQNILAGAYGARLTFLQNRPYALIIIDSNSNYSSNNTTYKKYSFHSISMGIC